jgi:hypothetical protein
LLSATIVPSPRRLPHSIFNRRTANNLSHRFARVIQQAVRTRPAPYHAIVAATVS